MEVVICHFSLGNYHYEGVLCRSSYLGTIKKYCSSLPYLDEDKIRLHFRDEGGDMVNVCQADI